MYNADIVASLTRSPQDICVSGCPAVIHFVPELLLGSLSLTSLDLQEDANF